MLHRFKQSMLAIYITIIVPLATTYLLTILQGVVLGTDKSSYKKLYLYFSNGAMIAASGIMILLALFIGTKHLYEILYYSIGIMVGFISAVLPIKVNSLFLQGYQLRYILMVGYVLSILWILLKNNKRLFHKSTEPI